jgi:hypothetical protein
MTKPSLILASFAAARELSGGRKKVAEGPREGYTDAECREDFDLWRKRTALVYVRDVPSDVGAGCLVPNTHLEDGERTRVEVPALDLSARVRDSLRLRRALRERQLRPRATWKRINRGARRAGGPSAMFDGRRLDHEIGSRNGSASCS